MKQGFMRARLTAGVSVIALAMTAVAAQAQQAGDDAPPQTVSSMVDGVETVVVTARHYVPSGSLTATKSDAPLIETPQSVSVVTRDQIDLLNFIDVQQAVRYTAGIVGENYGPDLRFDFLTLRGFTPVQYIDGVQAPITTTISNVGVDLYGFESVDILKGPSSVLYGTVPPGGIYNLTSRRASDTFGGEIGIKYGEDDYKQVEGTITGPVADHLSVRVTGLYRDRDSQVKGVTADRGYIAPTATLSLENTTLTALGYYQHDRVNGDTNGFLPVLGTLLPNPLGQIARDTNLGEPNYNYYQRDQYSVGYQLAHDFGSDIGFEQNLKWFHYKELQHVIYGAGLESDNRTVDRYNFPYQERVDELAIDNRLKAKVDTGSISHDLLAGVDYRSSRNNAQYGFAVAHPHRPVQPGLFQRRHRDTGHGPLCRPAGAPDRRLCPGPGPVRPPGLHRQRPL
ncbi:MAG: TonB-dependent receptor plug domain-containing protein [Azospirillaceae bacterium]|nr:TonB-dependent receptor plug domain-containing protein [Azospirillaceae bacterium]